MDDEPPDDAGQTAAQRIATAAREAETALSLAGLGLTQLPKSIRMLRYLTQLDLSDNLLTALPDWIGDLTALEMLVLRGNRLTLLPPSLARLDRLTQLDAADNRLLQVAPELAAMTRLAVIELRGNPHLLVPPPEVVAQGSHAVLAHLRGLGGGSAESATEVIPTPSPRPSSSPEPAAAADSGSDSDAGREPRTRRRVLMLGVPVLVIGAAIAITAAMTEGSPGSPSSPPFPSAQAAASADPVIASPNQTAAMLGTTLHPPTYSSPTPVPKHTTTHPAASETPPPTTTDTSSAAPADPTSASTYPIAAPGVDLAANGPATASSTMQNYVAANVVDGNPNTYWESLDGSAFPQTLTVNLGEVTTVGRFDFHLPQVSGWNERTETFTILGSTNGTDFFTIEPSAVYTFNANSSSDDSASLTITPVHTRYIELYFSATAGWPAAQLGELDAYS